VSYGLATGFEGKLMDARTRRHYCDLILWRGGEALPQDMVKAFLGRGPRPDSFFKEIIGRR
jgi:Zn-dependent oligopeptidase